MVLPGYVFNVLFLVHLILFSHNFLFYSLFVAVDLQDITCDFTQLDPWIYDASKQNISVFPGN